MKKVLVFGTFDILHPGHLYFLREAKKHGEHLTVVVTPSAVVKQLKGKAPMFGEVHRVATVKLMSFVDQVLIGDRTLSTFEVLKKSKPDVICIGYDQETLAKYIEAYYKKVSSKKLSFDQRGGPTFIRIKPYNPKQYKSGRLKKLLSGEEVCMRCRI
ncbi:MAG: adenylyltransferase/cytidyltransferase family protein [bacterium]|nr:adenylyltransferase/cytidyltransferase family protein [bacterium]